MTIPDFGDRIAQLFAQQKRPVAPVSSPKPTSKAPTDVGLGNSLNTSEVLQMFQEWIGTLKPPDEGEAPLDIVALAKEIIATPETESWQCPECNKVLAKPGRHPATHKKGE